MVDTGASFIVGNIIKVPRTGECMYVATMDPDGDNANEMTVVRGYGTTAAAALVDNDPVVIIGNANQEGATTLTVKSTQETEVYNYTRFGCAA